MHKINRETAIDSFREAVLVALDNVAREVFGRLPLAGRNDTGATDADLPHLFPAIDAQVERLAARYQATLTD